MGKIKGWKKKRNTDKFETWVSIRDNSVDLQKFSKAGTKYIGEVYIVEYNVNNIRKEKSNFFNYPEAKVRALRIMRSHSNG